VQKLLGRLAKANLHEYFRRVIIKFFLKKELISAKIAASLSNWRHSGFSVDASVHIPAGSSKTREALSQYIARPADLNISDNMGSILPEPRANGRICRM
jgi:hypothetical protein